MSTKTEHQIKRLKLDSKKRITLGKLISPETTGFDISAGPNGELILTPVITIEVPAGETLVSIPKEDAWLFKDKKALEAVKKGLKESAQNKTKLNAIDLDEDLD